MKTGAPNLMNVDLPLCRSVYRWRGRDHHHLFNAVEWIDGSQLAAGATAAYGIVIGLAAIGYSLIERAIIACSGETSAVASAIGLDWKGWGSIALYRSALSLAFGQRQNRDRPMADPGPQDREAARPGRLSVHPTVVRTDGLTGRHRSAGSV